MVIEGKRQMCAYTRWHICTHSLFVNDSFAWLEDIQSVRALAALQHCYYRRWQELHARLSIMTDP